MRFGLSILLAVFSVVLATGMVVAVECTPIYCPDFNSDGIIDGGDSEGAFTQCVYYEQKDQCRPDFDLNGDDQLTILGDVVCMQSLLGKNANEISTCDVSEQCVNCPDLNRDGIVNGDDYWDLSDCIHDNNCPETYDLNNDGTISILSDFYCLNKYNEQESENIPMCPAKEFCQYYLYVNHVALVDDHEIELVDIVGGNIMIKVDGTSVTPKESRDVTGVFVGVSSFTESSPQRPWQAHALLKISGKECKGLLPRELPRGAEGCGDGYCDAGEGKIYDVGPDGLADKDSFYIVCSQDCGEQGEFIKEAVCGDGKCERGEGKGCVLQAGEASQGEESCFYSCPQDCGVGFETARWSCYDGTEFTEEDKVNCNSYESWEGYAKLACNDYCDDNGRCGLDRDSLKLDNECGEPFWKRISNWFLRILGLRG